MTALPLATAVTDPEWEARLTAECAGGRHGLVVARRCLDLADVFSAASAGTVRAVLVSADLPRLDGDAVARVSAAGVAAVGVSAPGDRPAESRLRQLGVHAVVSARLPVEELAEALAAAVRRVSRDGRSYADPVAAAGRTPASSSAPARDRAVAGPAGAGAGGRTIAVWGPTGAPGRTSVALSLATEWAAQHRCVLLVDADVYGGAVGQALGLLDEAPGLAAAVRQANGGTLTRQVLRSTALQVKSGLAVLTGISRPQRWIELRPAAVEAVLATARAMFDVVVVDCGFSLERDEELSYDTAAPRRNGVTFAVLELANIVVAVGSADPIGMQRLLRALGDLREACPQVEPVVVLNKVRRSPGAGEADLRRLLLGECGSLPAACVPFEPDVFASAALAGRSLAESAPRSAARQVLRDLAGTLLGEATSDAVTGRPGWRLARQYRRRVAAGRTDQPAGAGS